MLMITSFSSERSYLARLLWISMQSLQVRLRLLNAIESGQILEQYLTSQLDVGAETLDKIEEDISRLAASQVQCITYFDSEYPERLKQIADPPLILFCIGQLAEFNFTSSTWGIVGARKASIAGLHLASRLAKLLAEHQQKIISGLAIGIDASAHQGALDSGQQASTLAVLGNGLPSVYPATNQNLARKIIQNGGLLLSQFYPFSRAYPANFLNRNRLIAGLSDNIVVIEASEQSGSRVTARYALEQGKNLYVIPGDISNPSYKGSNQLIKSGAEIITCIEDFYDFLPKIEPSRLKTDFSMPQELLLNEIQQNNGLSREDLKIRANNLGIASEVFYRELIILENNQKIKFLPGDFIQVY